MSWYIEVLKKYAVFAGRARRKEYWYFVLFNLLFYIVFIFVDNLVGSFNAEQGIGLFTGLYSLAVLLPGLAVVVRRLHDINRTGWWILICLIPVVGSIVFLIFMVLDSKPGENRYGPSPKPSMG